MSKNILTVCNQHVILMSFKDQGLPLKESVARITYTVLVEMLNHAQSQSFKGASYWFLCYCSLSYSLRIASTERVSYR